MVQRIGRQFPELEVGGSSPPGSARHGSRRCGRQSATLPLAGSTPARVSSVLTLWTAGDGWQACESKLAGYPLLMEWLRVRVPPAGRLAVAQRAEHLTIRCAPPHSPASLSSPAAVTALAVRAWVEDRRLPVSKTQPVGGRHHIRVGTGGAAGRVEDGRLSRDRKSKQVRVLHPAITSAWGSSAAERPV